MHPISGLIRPFAAALIVASPLTATAQSAPPSPPSTAKIPIRQLGAVTAKATDTLGALIVARPLSDGSVLVNDVARRRVLLYDPTLTRSTVVIDSTSNNATAGPVPVAVPSAHLIRYTGDTTLYVDLSSQSLLVLDKAGKVTRVMALPKPTDAIFIAVGAMFGTPGIEPKGRLIYRGQPVGPRPRPPEPGARIMFTLPVQPDSGPIIRADFDTRRVDTLMLVKVFRPGAMQMSNDNQGNMTLKMVMNPLDMGDEWTMLPDGTIAVVSAHDYHVEWLDPDGTRRSTPKMPFDWKRLTDEQKQFKIDSMRPIVEKQLSAMPAQTIPTADGPRRLRMQVDFPPLKELRDYEPPISPGSVKSDLDGNLWIVPRTTVSADGGLLYDIVNRKGELTERVQFPKGYALAGFAEGGVVYVVRTDGTTGFLERAKMR